MTFGSDDKTGGHSNLHSLGASSVCSMHCWIVVGFCK
jgi:hypothetical protein